MKKTRGKPITCKICKYSFRFNNEIEKEVWSNNRLKCPSCESLFCNLPESERELHLIQINYFNQNKQNTRFLDDMYKILYPYARSLICKKFPKSFATQDQLEIYARDSATLIIERIIETDDGITTSFGKMLYFKILETIYGKKNSNKDLDSIERMDDDSKYNLLQIVDTKSSINEFEEQDRARYVKNSMVYYLNKGLSRLCENKFENIIRLQLIYLQLYHGSGSVDRFIRNFGRLGKSSYLESMDFIKNELIRLRKENIKEDFLYKSQYSNIAE